jgi:hypothetical protein
VDAGRASAHLKDLAGIASTEKLLHEPPLPVELETLRLVTKCIFLTCTPWRSGGMEVDAAILNRRSGISTSVNCSVCVLMVLHL